MSARVIFIYGPAACGKLTVARTLSSLTGIGLFHNHLTVDLLLSVFPFGSPDFVRLREQIWTDVMVTAMRAKTNLIFTFAPENTVNANFVSELTRNITAADGSIIFVELICSEEIIEKRLNAPSRHAFLKLTSVDEYRVLKKKGAWLYPDIPKNISIDTGITSPEEAAHAISKRIELGIMKKN